MELAAAVDQDHVACLQHARLRGAVGEGGVGAEEDERAAARLKPPVRRHAPGRGLLDGGTLIERSEDRPVRAQRDLAGSTHERDLVGVLHHPAAGGDGVPLASRSAGAACAMPSEKANGIPPTPGRRSWRRSPRSSAAT
jgi:hypothetical protein